MKKPEAPRNEILGLYFSCCLTSEFRRAYYRARNKQAVLRERRKRERIKKAKKQSDQSILGELTKIKKNTILKRRHDDQLF
jgi:ribonucleotide reductase alpha subunit